MTTEAKKPAKPAAKPEPVTIADIARSIGMSPSVARGILRKSELAKGRTAGSAWEFDAAQKAKVVEILKAGAK